MYMLLGCEKTSQPILNDSKFFNMDILSIIFISYFVIGLILSVYWWNKEYKSNYEYDKENEEVYVEEPMVMIFLAFMVLFWPFVLLKNYFEGFMAR